MVERTSTRLALARKYRPRTFGEVAVQTHVSQTLKGAIGRGRVAQGYLLCGPRGVGKTTLARVLAMALNCEKRTPDGEPCGECDSCRRIWSGGTSLDVVEIDAASNRGVDDARDLRERAMYAPSGDGRYKVYIVDEAHMLTREAWNALLKILEEPPPRVVFVFATTEPQKIAQAAAPVLSRLQRFDFRRIGPAEVRDRLTKVLKDEGVESTPDALAMLARAADGSMRDALSLTDQVLSLGEGRITPDRVQEALGLVPEDEFIGMLDLISERRAADVFTAVARLADSGVDFGSLLGGLGSMIRAQLTVVLGGEPTDVSEKARAALEERKGRYAAADLLRMLSALTALEPQFRRSGQQRLLVETLLVRFALLDKSVDIETMLRELGTGGSTGSGASSGRDRSAPPSPARSDRAPMRGAASSETEAPQRPSRPARMATPSSSAAIASESLKPARRSMPTPAASAPVSGMETEIPLHDDADAPADVAPARASAPMSLDANRLAELWDDLVAKLGKNGRGALAGALSHMSPLSVTARGDVLIQLDEPNELYAHAFETGKGDILAALQEMFSGVQRVSLRAPGPSVAPTARRRMTEESLRAERVAQLRKKDPVLGAAIDALDLELME